MFDVAELDPTLYVIEFISLVRFWIERGYTINGGENLGSSGDSGVEGLYVGGDVAEGKGW